MKELLKKIALLVVLTLTAVATVNAKEISQVEKKMNQLVKKYENIKGVDCTVIEKGFGLNMVKLMFNKQFGKEFMKGVTGIIIIDYSDATPQTCQALRKELDAFISLLEEFKLDNEKEFAGSNYIRSFARPLDKKTISDFIIAMEDNDSKIIMYMAGKIKVEQ